MSNDSANRPVEAAIRHAMGRQSNTRTFLALATERCKYLRGEALQAEADAVARHLEERAQAIRDAMGMLKAKPAPKPKPVAKTKAKAKKKAAAKPAAE